MSASPIEQGGPPGTEPPVDGGAAAQATPVNLRQHRSFMDHVEAWASRMTSKYNWAHRLASMVYLPYAFRSGIKIKQTGDKTFEGVLPFRRFNRNWYNAMAGASLLGNAEIVGGTYIHGRCGGDYTVVCKELKYRFLRPCYGPAIYRVTPMLDLDELLRSGREFNLPVEIEVSQSLPTRGLGKTVRVGKCEATFHITPKVVHAQRAQRRAAGAAAASKSESTPGDSGAG